MCLVGARRQFRRALRRGRDASLVVARRLRTELDWLATRRGHADLALFHEFEPPPGGGGHQFLRALSGELRRRGLSVELNRLSGQTPTCLFNSFNFDFARLRRFARADARMVHRVDGPIGVYRGFDDGTDARIAEINAELAHATVVQSEWSLDKHRELGIPLRNPVVIHNTVDPRIFFPPERRPPLAGRRVRVIATSWSDNPRKGSGTLAWLDRNLDRGRFELTFVGRTSATFERIRAVPPVDSLRLAALLREHDLYLAPSRDDPCSNALLEGLACGLPAAYLRSGGHPELVRGAGVPFTCDEEVPEALATLADGIEGYRAAIVVPTLAEVADRYAAVLRLGQT